MTRFEAVSSLNDPWLEAPFLISGLSCAALDALVAIGEASMAWLEVRRLLDQMLLLKFIELCMLLTTLKLLLLLSKFETRVPTVADPTRFGGAFLPGTVSVLQTGQPTLNCQPSREVRRTRPVSLTS